jgi:hypothetical protein
MDYEPKPEKIRTDIKSRHTGKKLNSKKRKDIEDSLKSGKGIVATAKEVGSSEHTVTAVRNDLSAGGLELNPWKKAHRNNLMQAAAKMGERLVQEVENIPVGSLPLAIAIITDKAMSLSDQPTTITEHRLKISHDSLDAMLRGDVIDITPEKQNPESTTTDSLGNLSV